MGFLVFASHPLLQYIHGQAIVLIQNKGNIMSKHQVISTLQNELAMLQSIEQDYDNYVVCFGGHTGLYVKTCGSDAEIVGIKHALILPRPLARVQAKISRNGNGETSYAEQHAVAVQRCINETKRLIAELSK